MRQPPAGHERSRSPGAGRPEPAHLREVEAREHGGHGPDRQAEEAPHPDPDVLLDVPVVKVEEIDLEVDDLRARVALEAAVLDLLNLNVGADVALGRVKLTIKGVEAQALLKVRLDNVSEIIKRVLETIDSHPEILANITRGLGGAVGEVGQGAGRAVEDVGKGAGGAVRDVGTGAGGAVEDVGSGAGGAVRDVGSGAGGAVQDVGEGAGEATKDVGKGAGEATKGVGEGAGGAVQGVGEGAGEATRDVGKGAGEAAKRVGEGAGEAAEEAGAGARHGTDEAGAGELAGALAKKSAQLGREAAGRIAEAVKRMRES